MKTVPVVFDSFSDVFQSGATVLRGTVLVLQIPKRSVANSPSGSPEEPCERPSAPGDQEGSRFHEESPPPLLYKYTKHSVTAVNR